MSRNRPHIVNVSIPSLPAIAAQAVGEGAIAEAVAAAADRLTVVVTFGDASVYEYPDVPASLAVAVQIDPEGAFPNIKFWPGYRRIR